MIRRPIPLLLGLALVSPLAGLTAEPRGAASAAPVKADTRPEGDNRNEAGGAGPSAQIPCPGPAVSDADAKAAAQTASAYLNALRDGGFGAAPPLLHPQALERFKALVLPAFDAERARGTRNLLNATFGRDADYAAVSAADPAELMSRFARLISAREPDAAPQFSELTLVGVVREGERLHVLTRLGAAGGPQRLEVVSLLPNGDGWKVLLDGRLEAIAGQLAGRFGAENRGSSAVRMGPIPEGGPAERLEPQGPAGLPPAPGPESGSR